MARTPADVIAEHRRAGRELEAAGVRSFARDEGEGPVVLLHHGVPVSSLLYRKVVGELAGRGFRAVSFDYPGLGLAERPEGFDYSWGGLARWSAAATDALEIDRAHLVVHDVGGPVGLEWAVRHPDRVASLTVLDTVLGVASFTKPWTMRPFGIPGVGELWLASMTRPAWRFVFALQGAQGDVPREEVDAHLELLKREDGGRAFLRIMRGFETTDAKQRLLWSGLAPDARPYPAQIVWGRHDPALGEDHRRTAERVLGVATAALLEAKHFVQEDRPRELAGLIADFATQAGRGKPARAGGEASEG